MRYKDELTDALLDIMYMRNRMIEDEILELKQKIIRLNSQLSDKTHILNCLLGRELDNEMIL